MSKRRKVLTAVLFGSAAIGAIVLALGARNYANSPEGQRRAMLIDEMRQAEHAQGTDALRALGCKAAMVSPSAVFATATEMAHDSGRPIHVLGPAFFVTCGITRDSPALECNGIAKSYVSAVGGHAAGPLEVVVRNMHDGTEKCRSDYGEDGAPSDAGSINP